MVGVERELGRTGVAISRAVMSAPDAKAAVEQYQRRCQSLLAREEELLAANGLPRDFLAPKPHCPKCGDTGYQNGERCECLEALIKQESLRRINRVSHMTLSSFDDFRLNYYPSAPDATGVSPRRRMEKVLSFCRAYASGFSPDSPSILMVGPTGLGKSHLSLAIAREVIDKGYGVIYGAAQDLLSAVEKERFGDGEKGTLEQLLRCDLLIIDDLGSEFSTSFTVSAVYTIVNTRMGRGGPTIINTNLTFPEIESRYTQKVVSRLFGHYEQLRFFGDDIRVQKQVENRQPGRDLP